MGKDKAARSRKWSRRATEYIDRYGPLTYEQLMTTRKMVNFAGSDKWMRERLSRLEAQSIIWWDPSTGQYATFPTRADAPDRARPCTPPLGGSAE